MNILTNKFSTIQHVQDEFYNILKCFTSYHCYWIFQIIVISSKGYEIRRATKPIIGRIGHPNCESDFCMQAITQSKTRKSLQEVCLTIKLNKSRSYSEKMYIITFQTLQEWLLGFNERFEILPSH